MRPDQIAATAPGGEAALGPSAPPGERGESIDPLQLALAHYDRAVVCALQGDVGGAIAAYETALQFAPIFAEAQSNLGTLYWMIGRRDDALRAFEAAARFKPELAPLHCNLAALLLDLERCDEAIAALETALRLAPDLYEAQLNLSHAYRRCDRQRDALGAALRAAQLRPDRDVFVSLAAAAFEHDELEIAIDANRGALELDADCAEAHSNLGWIAHVTGRYAQAVPACEAAIARRPDFIGAHRNLAQTLLLHGEFARGWEEYAWVWRNTVRCSDPARLPGMALWNGEQFADRQLLVTADDSYADAIQMARYLPAVKARGGRVSLEVRPALIELFAQLPGIDELHLRSGAASLADDVDLQVPLLGLPRALGADAGAVPAPIPYLAAPPERVERWRPRLAARARLRVGIRWAGNSGRADDRRRFAQLADFAGLAGIDGIAWFGLQKGRDEELRASGSFALEPLGAQIDDFADIAAVIAGLDLVIAVDSAIVHLAGAMGKHVWTLLPFVPDWRWQLGRADSPWYPTMRLFRQPVPGDWASVFAAVARELRAAAT